MSARPAREPRPRTHPVALGCFGLLGALFAPAEASAAPAEASAAEVAAREGIEMSQGYPVTRPERLFPLADIREGQRGVGFTVFRGGEVEPFEVQVLGVLEGMAGPGSDVILARLSGRQIEFTGVIAGMSGSPVYIDGRLVGAVAYRFGDFTREPIAGITPIERMLPLLERAPGTAVRAPPPPPTLAAGRAPRSTEALALPVASEVGGGATPIAALSAAGLHPLAAARLERALPAHVGLSVGAGHSTRGVSPNQASEAGRVVAPPILPGAPIAALVAAGDVNLASIGTVTYVQGSQVLGFGHPFQSDGAVAFPMATAAIINTLASARGSYKQGVPSLEVGTVLQDRLTAISGTLGGQPPPMVPMEVRVADEVGPVELTRVRLASSPTWLPIVTDAVLASAVLRRIGAEPGGTVRLKLGVEVDDLYLEVNDRYAAPAPVEVAAYAARDVATIVGVIARTALATPRIGRIRADISIERSVEAQQLVEAELASPSLRPGQTAHIVARMRSYRGPERLVRLALLIPPGTPEGVARIHVGGGFALDRRDVRARGNLQPTTVAELLGKLADRRPSDGLYARLYTPQPGLRIGASVLPALPPTMAATLGSRRLLGAESTRELPGPQVHVALPGATEGGVELKLEILAPLEPRP